MHRLSASPAYRCALLVILSLITLSAPAFAQWTPVPAFNAGNWTKCVAGLAGEAFVIHQSGTLYRSTDNGAHWTNCMPAGARAVTAILPQPSGIVFAGMTFIGGDGDPPGVFLSTDDGATWQSSALVSTVGDPVAGLAMTSGGTLVAITQYGSVWGSTDLGSSWVHLSNLPAGPIPLPIVHDVLEDANSTIFVANDNALYTSSDGTSWSGLSVFAPVLHLATYPVGPVDYFATANAAYQFPPPDGQPIPDAPGGTLCSLSDGSLLIGGRYRYDGSSVTATPAQMPGTVSQVALISGTTLMAATSQGIFVSPDELNTYGDAAAPARVPVTTIGGLGSSGVMASDGDAAFASRFTGDPMHRTILTGSTKPIAVVPTASGGFAASRDGGVFRSDDGGLTWSLMNAFAGVHLQALARGSSGIVLVGSDGGSGDPLYASDDDGASWSPLDPSAFTGDNVTALATTGTKYLAAVMDALNSPKILVSTDGSASIWTPVAGALPARVDRLAAVSTSELYALCAGTLLRSAGGGISWSSVRLNVTSFVVDSKGRIWATMGSAPYVVFSSDHGASWTPMDSGTSGVISSLALAPSQEIYAGGAAGDYRTTQPVSVSGGVVPVARFGIALAGSNPVHGALHLACTVEHAGPVSLAVIDVTGRCIARSELVAPAAGTWGATFARPFEAGLYFVRAEQDGRVATTRAAIVK